MQRVNLNQPEAELEQAIAAEEADEMAAYLDELDAIEREREIGEYITRGEEEPKEFDPYDAYGIPEGYFLADM